MKIADCNHFPSSVAKPRADKCEEGDVCNFGLRVCLTCGYVGCCDSCQKHERQHAKKTDHQVMASYPADRSSFVWCYEHDSYLEQDDEINLENRNTVLV